MWVLLSRCASWLRTDQTRCDREQAVAARCRRPPQAAPGRNDEADHDEDHALGSAGEPDVAFQPQRFRPGARIADEERSARERREGEGERGLVPVAREDEPDGAEHERLPDAVGGRVDEGAERRRLAAGAREGAVEDVEDRAEQEEGGAEPEEALLSYQ
jgi:hypothetical protein